MKKGVQRVKSHSCNHIEKLYRTMHGPIFNIKSGLWLLTSSLNVMWLISILFLYLFSPIVYFLSVTQV